MASLHYRNLGVDHPNTLMSSSVRGLKIFYDFLTRAKEYMESDSAVLRLAQRRGNSPENVDDDKPVDASWVQLVEPEDRPNEPEATFRSFLDENVREIYYRLYDEQREFSHNRIVFKQERRISVLDRHPETQQLLLERLPGEGAQILLRPNTYVIECQRRALRSLQDAPRRPHLPLLRLFERLDRARWSDVSSANIGNEDWMVLTDANRAGTSEQRRFVETALGTPDFAFLEGPPGSGKTTAICELILQLVKRRKRTLLCASTHVAVDNVIERLMDKDNAYSDLTIPIRIGDRMKVSEKTRRWQLEEFVETERRRILSGLKHARPLTSSQRALYELLRQGNDVIQRMVLEAANPVCGTAIGILQHPDIRQHRWNHRNADPVFDFFIIDEASKTPFHEFLVPAQWAKRWIVVGDPRQLSPYVDDAALATNIESCLPEREVRNACIDAFLAANRGRVAAVAADSRRTRKAYEIQCGENRVNVVDAEEASDVELRGASVVVGKTRNLVRRTAEIPLDVATIRCGKSELPLLRRRVDAWLRLSGRGGDEQPEWAREVGWRLATLYELRFTEETDNRGMKARLEKDIEKLLPAPELKVNREKVRSDIDRARRVALPSVLESLQCGFERDTGNSWGTALSDGLPESMFKQRHVLLSTQHRMHPEIAEFSRVHIYFEKALRTPFYMKKHRDWSYARYGYRAIWIDVPAGRAFRNNSNEKEAKRVVEELHHFEEWAKINRQADGLPWTVAVLTFYRGQEREIRRHLQRWTGLGAARRHFYLGSQGRPYVALDLCTVDRFQGHEADLVLISFANQRPTRFLESSNRLNVALTRARYQRVVIGDIHAMRRAMGDALREFAKGEPWEKIVGMAKP